MAEEKKEGKNLSVLDTGSTCHIRYSDKGMSDLVEVNDTVEVGDGHGVIITHRGTFQGRMKLDDGKFQKIKLKILRWRLR